MQPSSLSNPYCDRTTLHNKKKQEKRHIKRTQKDYNLSSRVTIISEIKQGESGVKAAIKKDRI